MCLIKWNDTLSVEVDEFDRQHQRLITMINRLHDGMLNRVARTVLEDILSGLYEYALEHFASEETLFDRYGYPDREEHKKEHVAFMEKVIEFKQGFEEGRLLLSMDVINFLLDWLGTHIEDTDKKYASFLSEKIALAQTHS